MMLLIILSRNKIAIVDKVGEVEFTTSTKLHLKTNNVIVRKKRKRKFSEILYVA